MTDDELPSRRERVPLPSGYRQGVISAITVLLGFSLLFLRYWSFEAEGEWNFASLVALGFLALAIIMELYALWRSLQPEDDDEATYRVTLLWFLASTIALTLSLVLAALHASHVAKF